MAGNEWLTRVITYEGNAGKSMGVREYPFGVAVSHRRGQEVKTSDRRLNEESSWPPVDKLSDAVRCVFIAAFLHCLHQPVRDVLQGALHLVGRDDRAMLPHLVRRFQPESSASTAHADTIRVTRHRRGSCGACCGWWPLHNRPRHKRAGERGEQVRPARPWRLENQLHT